jgi:hypothetical protein
MQKKLELDLELCKIGKSTFFCSLKFVSGGTVIQPTNLPPPGCFFLCCLVKRPWEIVGVVVEFLGKLVEMFCGTKSATFCWWFDRW